MTARTNVFAGSTLERNAELRDDAEWAAAQRADPKARHVLLAADGRAVIQAGADALRLLGTDELHAFVPEPSLTYLGSDEIGPLFFVSLEQTLAHSIAAAVAGDFIDLRSAGTRLHPFQAGLFATARALAFWHVRTRFCGVCGARAEWHAMGHRAKCTNPECATEHFPRVDPAMIVIVSWREQCLLGRQSSWPEGRYSTLAGFVEPGESLEDAVRREVFEEAGVRVGECEYYSSQPWPFPSSLMLGFTAKATGPAISVGRELSDARWFGVDDLIGGLADRSIVLPPRVSVSHELIAHWLRQTAGLELTALLSDEPWLRPSA
ncbi:MAG TPA: NAD(+) diphosphatase [Dokdonella sp.]